MIKDLSTELDETKLQLLKAVEINNKNALNSLNGHGDTKLNDPIHEPILPYDHKNNISETSKALPSAQDISHTNGGDETSNSVHEMPL